MIWKFFSHFIAHGSWAFKPFLIALSSFAHKSFSTVFSDSNWLIRSDVKILYFVLSKLSDSNKLKLLSFVCNSALIHFEKNGINDIKNSQSRELKRQLAIFRASSNYYFSTNCYLEHVEGKESAKCLLQNTINYWVIFNQNQDYFHHIYW